MAIKVEKKEGGKTVIEIDNGHSVALDQIVSDYNIKGASEALSFMIAVFSQAKGKPIEVEKVTYVPSEGIKNSPSK